ncbi:hypothetical protein B0H11DRAFT_2290581 [Mycena galericulata]|nr:hypothetical protein B0H11DRAFT_2290581 [Mycena galericulata]
MFSRLSRARVPLTRCLQTQSPRSPSNTTKYAIAVGTFATVAFLGTQAIALDSEPSLASLAPPRPTAATFKSSLLNKKLAEDPTPIDVLNSNARSPESVSSLAPSQSEPEHGDDDKSGGDSGGGAFNPETGEINWDCPCLGGMAHGPCGPEFREAFSCFVHSEDEPKGINCVEKFQGMQTCFREHPDVYASEIADDEEAEAAEREASQTGADKEQQQPVSRAETADSESASSSEGTLTDGEKETDRRSETVNPSSPDPKSSEEVPSSQQ